MALEGDLRIFQLPDMLQVVSLQKKTGILTIQGEQDIIAISFLEGAVVAADALNQSVEDGLGQVLMGAGWVPPDQFASVVAEHQAGGERLVDLLLARGLLDRPRLLRALREQTYRLLLLALQWREGEFKFYVGEEVSFEEGFEPIPVEAVLNRAIEDLSREWIPGAPRALDPADRLEKVPYAGTLRVLGTDGESPTDAPGELWLPADDARLLEATDGKQTAGEVAASLGLVAPLALFGYLRLARAGLVRVFVPHESVPAPAPVPAAAAAPAAPVLAEVPGPAAAGDEETPAAALVAVRLRRFAALLAAAVALLLFASAVRMPLGIATPFPWQAEIREQAQRLHRAAATLGIDRAARAFYLVEGRYPEDTGELIDLGLLAGTPRDAAGRAWQIVSSAASYQLLPRGAAAGEAVTEGITGDFLLDPDFVHFEGAEAARALVLLD